MKVCVVGAGGIGGTLAAAFARGGAQVCLLARGATSDAIERDGLAVERGGRREVHRLSVSTDPATLGHQDLVVIAVKAPSLPSVVLGVRDLMGPGARVMTAMNGVPWWFLQGGFGGAISGSVLRSVDPGGSIAALVPADRVIGAVVHLGADVLEPGVVRHLSGDQIVVGNPAGGADQTTRAVAQLLTDGGLRGDISQQIQRDVWWKLWGNMTMNPISLLTASTMDVVLDDDLVVELIDAVMLEAKALGAVLGIDIDQAPADRHRITRRLGVFRTSMLQDVHAERPVELDALLGAVVELGQLAGVPMPTTRMLFGLARVRARSLGLYPPA